MPKITVIRAKAMFDLSMVVSRSRNGGSLLMDWNVWAALLAHREKTFLESGSLVLALGRSAARGASGARSASRN